MFQKAYGLASVKDGRLNSLETVFPIASLSEQFTAGALIAWQQNRSDDAWEHLAHGHARLMDEVLPVPHQDRSSAIGGGSLHSTGGDLLRRYGLGVIGWVSSATSTRGRIWSLMRTRAGPSITTARPMATPRP